MMGKIIDRVRVREEFATGRRSIAKRRTSGNYYAVIDSPEPIDWMRIALCVAYGSLVCGLLVYGGVLLGRAV